MKQRMKTNRYLSGLKAKAIGDQFENEFEKSCIYNDVAFIHLPKMGGQFINKNKIKGCGIVCDFIIGYKGEVRLVDTKCLNKDTLSYSTIFNNPSFRKQVTDLSKFQRDCKSDKQLTGFIVHLKKANKVCFFKPITLWNIHPKQSVGIKDADYVFDSNKLFKVSDIFQIKA